MYSTLSRQTENHETPGKVGKNHVFYLATILTLSFALIYTNREKVNY